MTTLLDREPREARPAAPGKALLGARHAVADSAAAAAVRIVDHSFHFAALLARAALYSLLAWQSDRVSCGPHLLAGLLCGDFAASVLRALGRWREAPEATIAELVLFSALFSLWWSRYAGPQANEDKAVFFLVGFGVLASRLTAAMRE